MDGGEAACIDVEGKSVRVMYPVLLLENTLNTLPFTRRSEMTPASIRYAWRSRSPGVRSERIGDDLFRIIESLDPACLVVEETQVIVHKADERDLLLDFADTHLLAGEDTCVH
jgi:hypothetical protein